MSKCRSLISLCHVVSSSYRKGMFAVREHTFLLFVLILFGCLTQGAAWSQMAQLNNEDLKGITGQAGVSINLEGTSQTHFDVVKISDTEPTPNWIELHNFKVDNGAGGAYFFSTRLLADPAVLSAEISTYMSNNSIPDNAALITALSLSATFDYLDSTTWTFDDLAKLAAADPGPLATAVDGYKAGMVPDPVTIDVATKVATDTSPIPVGTTFITIRNTSNINPRWYSVERFVFNALNATKTSVEVSNAISTYMVNNAIPDNAALITALSLDASFNYLDLTTWTTADLTALASAGDSNLATKIGTYQTTPVILQTQPLGSIRLEALREGPSVSRFWAPTVGQGIRFDHMTTISADALTYAYNTTATGSLKFSNISIAGSATGALDDPATPSTWEFGGTSNVFKIGTIGDAANAPATMDVGTDSNNVTSVYMSLPMAGTVRVAEVNFGGNNFGPIAIDGIQFHRLDIKLTP